MQDMIESYKYTRRFLRACRTLNTDQGERRTIGEMISDCDYALDWIRSGRRPGTRRGIERRAAYQREKLMDPLRMQAFVSDSHAGSASNITDWERFQIEDALSRLSDRERECYVLKHGQCFSFEEIARMLQLSKGSVVRYVKRAQKKVSEDVEASLFLRG